MSRSNIQLARDLYDSFMRGEIKAARDLLDPDFELQPPAGTPEEDTYKGYESAGHHLEELMEPFRDIQIETEEFMNAGDRHVLVTVHVSGKGRTSGLPIDTRFAHLLTMSEGKVTRLQAFLGKEEALRIARLAE